ncbi:hypothetical protein EDD27_8252 [Nonomuraea polychroma]|uniref:Uncharacterized protein n=1 Tax=Nonomuraea polychroma TaxID=46176 RepID=A0A438MIG5_9ACTN|nr:hypothetical protein [Nonomuraea polychroma]RVX45453.1 hypothetical protein EDD27_8252 [Nonomuraea polychroma]
MSESIASVSFHLGSDVRMKCMVYPQSGPILSLDICGANVAISPAGREQITDDVLATVREFASQAQRFLSECERVHSLQLDQANETAA